MTTRSLGHRAPLLWLILPTMGLAVGKVVNVPATSWLLATALVGALFTLVVAWRAPRWWAVTLSSTLFLAGIASYTLHRARLLEWEALPRREARLVLRVDRVFPQLDAKKTGGLATVVQSDDHLRDLVNQRIYFSLAVRKGELAPVRSAIIKADGLLETVPKNPPADSFAAYLANAGVNFRLSRGRVLATVQAATAYRSFLEHGAIRLNAILSRGVGPKRPELTAVYRAIMLGQKHELTEEQNTLFMHSGTMHLFAINGLHIGVVAVALHALFAVLRCPRPIAALLTLAILWLDVDTTGASPSAVRAFMLVAAYETAFVFRLPATGISALALAAFVVLLIEPLALFSASFQMSYGVVLAILCFGLPLAEHFESRWLLFKHLPSVTQSWWQRGLNLSLRWLFGALGIGLAASLVGAISGAAFYQSFTPGGLLINLALVPLATLVIIAGFGSVAVGLAGFAAGSSLLNHAAVLVLCAIDGLIRVGVQIPGAWWTAQWRTEWAAPLVLVLLIGTFLGGYANRWQRRHGGFWPPFVVVAIALVVGVKFGV